MSFPTFPDGLQYKKLVEKTFGFKIDNFTYFTALEDVFSEFIINIKVVIKNNVKAHEKMDGDAAKRQEMVQKEKIFMYVINFMHGVWGYPGCSTKSFETDLV